MAIVAGPPRTSLMKASPVSVCLFLGILSIAPAAPGNADPAFNPNANNEVFALALQPDGKIIAGGTFLFMNGTSRPYFARLHPNGLLDTAFTPVTNGQVQSIGVRDDLRILLTGVFTTVGGVDRTRIASLSAGGTPDAGFVTAADSDVRSLSFLNDGKVIFGGLFTALNGTARNYLARVNPAGNLDLAFNPAPDGPVRVTALQPDGKLLFGGQFATVASVTRNRIARMNANGTLDLGFNPNVDGSAVYCVSLQADGKIVIGGLFTAVGGVPRLNVARLNADGTVDAGFNPGANDIVRCAAIQTDGRIILTGNFTMAGGGVRNRIARLHPGGLLDNTFDPNANNNIYGAVLQPDGKVVVGGLFSMVGGEARGAIARLENDEATQSLTITAPDRVQWLRGGASPETHRVGFELSVNGGTAWTPLGNGTRIAGGWEITGLELPANGQIRARAGVTGGYANASFSLLESVASFTFSPIEMWRWTNFGTVSNSGNAADHADPDSDGLENLIEFAFGLAPDKPDAGELPAWRRKDDDFILTFAPPPETGGVSYIAEFSSTLATESWTEIPNSSSPPDYAFHIAARAGRRLYLRVRVTEP